jgi:hypothetical protein
LKARAKPVTAARECIAQRRLSLGWIIPILIRFPRQQARTTTQGIYQPLTRAAEPASAISAAISTSVVPNDVLAGPATRRRSRRDR